MIKNAIVTGATSFIGMALIEVLAQSGINVVAIIRPKSARKKLLRGLFPDVSVVECELNDLYRLSLPNDKYDVLFHIGWTSDFCNSRFNLEGQLQNVTYCENAVKLAAKYNCKKYLCVGSQAECGIVNMPINSMTPDNPITAYAEAKCIAYDKTKKMCHEYGIEQYWPRLLSAYGPYDRNTTMIMSCINACKEKKKLDLTPAEQIWDYVYVGDVAKALLAIVEKGTSEKKYSIASGVGRPLKEYIGIISDIMEYPDLLYGIGKRQYAESQVMYLVGDIEELKKDTNFNIKCGFELGIKKILIQC